MVARASVDRSKRAEDRRRSTFARRRIRPRGAATSQLFSGWLKASALSNMNAMVVTLETCGGGDVGAEVGSNGRIEKPSRCRRASQAEMSSLKVYLL